MNWAHDCLRNTTTWVIGDSNANMLYLSFLAITGCINKTGGWPRSSMCVVQQHGIKIIAIPHEKPIYAKLQRADHIGSIPAVLDNINSTGKHIVFVHYYLHYTPAHPSVFYLRMKALKAAVERLVKRNPNVLTVIRGPHAAIQDCKHNRAIGGDPLAPLYIEIIKTMFRGLENKVLFLDGWDLTIAIESNGIHPPAFVTREMIKIALSYFCK
ncbi:NXPE family member 1-like [Physella acuta]|uniref:NXPE family member 1-like n=1 Tax=Physella acuta TaxID=109671 RepID=UPI0027DBE885|nr:NXPE family member 1-like [Physella acuta]